ncbi:MAG TPA: alpha/beta fold hydrolase [Actinomycetes bacterium]
MSRRSAALPLTLVLVTLLVSAGYLALGRGPDAAATATAGPPPLPRSASTPGGDRAAAPAGTWRVGLPDGRSYLLAVPPGPERAGRTVALPLLVVVHGRTSDAARFARTTRFTAYAETGRAVVVFPDATAPPGDKTSWNAGSCCRPAVLRGVDDVGYLQRVLADVRSRVAVDRVWYVGFSNGAMLGYRLACEHPEMVDAVVAVAGSRVGKSCTPARSIPFLDVHGDADATVPLHGTPWSARLHTALPSAFAAVGPLAAAAGCTGWTPVTSAEDDVSVRAGVGCRVPVGRVRISGLSHHWDPRETPLAWSFLTSSRSSALLSPAAIMHVPST